MARDAACRMGACDSGGAASVRYNYMDIVNTTVPSYEGMNEWMVDRSNNLTIHTALLPISTSNLR